jgi:hypothetical protein
VALDQAGLLDRPDYMAGLPERDRDVVSRRNVFAFSMSVAAHEVVQFAGIVSGLPAVGGREAGCEYRALEATALPLTDRTSEAREPEPTAAASDTPRRSLKRSRAGHGHTGSDGAEPEP